MDRSLLLLVAAVYLLPRAPIGDDEEADEFEELEEDEDQDGEGLRLRRS